MWCSRAHRNMLSVPSTPNNSFLESDILNTRAQEERDHQFLDKIFKRISFWYIAKQQHTGRVANVVSNIL
jgi:hypothetical protein